MERFRHQQYRDSTRKNYYTIWKIFAKFLIKLDYRPNNWEDCLTLFVGHLIDNHKQSSTVKCYISAIKAVLQEDNNTIQEDQYLLSSLIRACKLKNDQIKTRLPLKKGMLCILLTQINSKYADQPYLKLLYSCLFSTMYHGLLRISEVAEGIHTLKARDVQIGENKDKFLLLLHTSKTHWKNMKPQIIKISATKIGDKVSEPKHHCKQQLLKLPCPFELLRSFALIRGGYVDDSEPFFVFADKSPIHAFNISACLQTLIKECGFDSKLYSSHSL